MVQTIEMTGDRFVGIVVPGGTSTSFTDVIFGGFIAGDTINDVVGCMCMRTCV